MKPTIQPTKTAMPNAKTRRNLKEKEKKKSQNSGEVANHNSVDKGSPVKESNYRLYAGIDAESLRSYTEQSNFEVLSEEVSNIITEDINYKIRYIINDALLQARLSGKSLVTPSELQQTFENLNISQVYGVPKNPNWESLEGYNVYYLEDKSINLFELAEESKTFVQSSDPIITKKILPEKEISTPLKNYFVTMCQMLVNKDVELRKLALKNIGENSRISPIIEWFYNFAFILLSQDISRNCLTIYALDLLEMLEKSPNCRVNVSELHLRIIIRLILQRLIKTKTKENLLKPMCSVLKILCHRFPLREFVLIKIKEKLLEIYKNYSLPILTIVSFLGINAVYEIFLPNIDLFLKLEQSQLNYTILELYNVICKQVCSCGQFYSTFYEHFGDAIVIYNRFQAENSVPEKDEINFISMKRELIKIRRKLPLQIQNKKKVKIEEIFEMSPVSLVLKNKLKNQTKNENYKIRIKIKNIIEMFPVSSVLKNKLPTSQTKNKNDKIIVGKTCLILPELKIKKNKHHMKNGNLLLYNF